MSPHNTNPIKDIVLGGIGVCFAGFLLLTIGYTIDDPSFVDIGWIIVTISASITLSIVGWTSLSRPTHHYDLDGYRGES